MEEKSIDEIEEELVELMDGIDLKKGIKYRSWSNILSNYNIARWLYLNGTDGGFMQLKLIFDREFEIQWKEKE